MGLPEVGLPGLMLQGGPCSLGSTLPQALDRLHDRPWGGDVPLTPVLNIVSRPGPVFLDRHGRGEGGRGPG